MSELEFARGKITVLARELAIERDRQPDGTQMMTAKARAPPASPEPGRLDQHGAVDEFQ
jgi:hypothetical protein